MKIIVFITCIVIAVCSLIYAYVLATGISSPWRWILIIPGILSAIIYGGCSWHFRPWHRKHLL